MIRLQSDSISSQDCGIEESVAVSLHSFSVGYCCAGVAPTLAESEMAVMQHPEPGNVFLHLLLRGRDCVVNHRSHISFN